MKKFFKQKNRAYPQCLKRSFYRRGFTLIETMVAISIFTMSILGLLVILSKGISDTGYIKKKVVSGYLAQEGIEYVRNMRDTYMLNSVDPLTGWNNFRNKLLDASCSNADGTYSTNGCYFNADGLVYTFPADMPMTKPALVPFTICGSSCTPLKFDVATGIYGYTTGTDSGFIRKINAIVGTTQVKIFSTVYWSQGSGSYSMVFSEVLYNWIQ